MKNERKICRASKLIVVMVLFTMMAVGCADIEDVASDSNPQKVGSVDSASSDSNNDSGKKEDTVFVVGDVVETSDLKISFLSAGEYVENNEFLQPAEGKMYFKAEFEIENIGAEDTSISSMLGWTCYADDYEMDQAFVGDDTLDGSISKGKKLKGSLYYEIPVETTEVILEYRVELFGDNKVVFKAK